MVKRIPGPVIWGWGLTVLVAFGAVVLGFGPICEDGVCQTKFAALWAAPPNEIGDTLAGFAGALAFVWIIVTVMLQSKELKAQREVLFLTKTEMEEQRKATQDMARSMKAQAEIFEDERQTRLATRAKDVLDQRVRSLVKLCYREDPPTWGYWIGANDFLHTSYINLTPDFRVSGEIPDQDALEHICDYILEFEGNYDWMTKEGTVCQRPNGQPFVIELARNFRRLLEIVPDLSGADHERIQRARAEEAHEALERIHEMPIWNTEEEFT